MSDGTRGKGYKTEITVEFINPETKEVNIIVASFIPGSRSAEKHMELSGRRKIHRTREQIILNKNEAEQVVRSNRFLFVESSNIDLPKIVTEIFKEDVLPDLDRLRSRQTQSLDALKDFIVKSKAAVADIENDVSVHFQSFLSGTEGIDATKWKAKVNFPEFAYLREAISRLVSFTIHDTNDRELSTKGSGVQRMALLALLRYVYDKSKSNVIWAIDEPEAFLQPSLQKHVYRELKLLSKGMDIILTTHSPHFIDIANVDFTYLLDTKVESATYTRMPDKVFDIISTEIEESAGVGKVEAIRHHIGIQRNDAWHNVPSNLLVEGQDDRDYLQCLFRLFDLEMPNILVANGSSKVKGYLQFLEEFCSELEFKPKFVVIFDHDGAGRSEYQSLKSKITRGTYKSFDLEVKYIPRCDAKTQNLWEHEIEDFMYHTVIIDAANAFLKQKKYKTIKKSQIDNRFKQAYEQTNVLKFLTLLATTNNPDKPPFNFESDGLKLILCRLALTSVSRLSTSEILQLDSDFPKPRAFLAELLASMKVGAAEQPPISFV